MADGRNAGLLGIFRRWLGGGPGNGGDKELSAHGGPGAEVLLALSDAYPGLQVRLDPAGIVVSGDIHPACQIGIPGLTRGTDFYSQAPEGMGSCVRELLRCAVENAGVQHAEVAYSADPHGGWCSVSMVPGGDGSYYLFAFDITERKRREAEYEDLEQRLRHVYRMEALGQLAGGLAHDFNNLLTVITGHAQILRSQLGPAAAGLENLDKIQRASDGAASLTRALLDFSRTSIVHPEWVDLNQTLSHLERYLDRLLRDDVELALDLGGGLDKVWVDRGSMEQVFVSLAGNAAGGMPTGGRFRIGTKAVQLAAEDRREGESFAPGHYVLVTMQDTVGAVACGDGQPAEQFAASTRTTGFDAGLALESIQGTMDLVNGLLRMSTTEGLGRIITLYFPTFKPPIVAPEERAVRPQGSGLQGKETLLVCDDDDDVRGVMREALVAAGYTVILAESAADALLLEDESDEALHMLVTDLVMPRVTGAELAEIMRERRPGLRVLFVTGYSTEVIQHQTALDEDDALLPKPFTPQDLLEQVRELLDRRDAHVRS